MLFSYFYVLLLFYSIKHRVSQIFIDVYYEHRCDNLENQKSALTISVCVGGWSFPVLVDVLMLLADILTSSYVVLKWAFLSK